MPKATLDLLAARGDRVRFVRGNCDREMGSILERAPDPTKSWEPRARWAAENVTAAQRDLLAGLPTTVEVDVEGLGPVLFCHGSPRDDDEIITRLSPESRLAPMLEGVTAGVVVGGHTHVQFDRRVLGKRLVNAGSVGSPYEDQPGAYWLVLGPEVDLRRTSYDLEAAARELRASGYPEVDEFIQMSAPAPNKAAETSEYFEEGARKRDALRAG